MMVLIDTHVLIWALYDSDQLSAGAKDAIARGDCCVSIASLWEMSIKIFKGQLVLKDTILEIARRCMEMGVEILPIKPEHCQQLQVLPPYHKDPFDRMIVAQALVEGCPLVTKDENIWKGYDALQKIW